MFEAWFEALEVRLVRTKGEEDYNEYLTKGVWYLRLYQRLYCLFPKKKIPFPRLKFG